MKQLNLPLQLSPECEAFISGYKEGMRQAQNARFTVTRHDVYRTLHVFMKGELYEAPIAD